MVIFKEDVRRGEQAEGERNSGVIRDEIARQTDIQIDKHGVSVEISGLTDDRNEGNPCNALKQGFNEKKLGKYALKLPFLETNGFLFPFAYLIFCYLVLSGKQCAY